MMKNYIIVGTCRNLLRQVLLGIHDFADTARVIVIGGKNTRVLGWSSLCGRHVLCSFHPIDDGAFIENVNRIADCSPQSVVIPADCEGIRIINRVRPRLRAAVIPVPEASTLELFENKWRFHEFCIRNRLRVPATLYIGEKSALDFAAVVDALGLPFVVKPSDRAGSEGVHIVQSEPYFRKHIAANDAYRFHSLIAQRYVPGIDLCFSFLALHGEVCALAIQKRIGSEVRFMPNHVLEKFGRQLARAANYHGVMNLDARMEERTGKIYLIESNPRFWASLGASVCCGLNFVAESIGATPRPHGPRRLTEGCFQEAHPVLRPASWIGLASNTSPHGRMFRARMRDMPALAEVLRSLPAMLWKYASRRFLPQQLMRRHELKNKLFSAPRNQGAEQQADPCGQRD